MNTLSRDELKEIAWLARLELSEQELDRFQEQTKMVLAYVASLDSVIIDEELQETKKRVMLNELRDDQITGAVSHEQKEQADRELLLANAPLAQEDFFVVPHILGHTREQE